MGFCTCAVNVKLKEWGFIPDFLNVSWSICRDAFITAIKPGEKSSSVDVDFMISSCCPESCSSQEKDTIWLELVKVRLEDGEGFIGVRVGFINVFYVPAGWDLIVDITAEAVRH